MQFLGIDWGTRRAAWCALTPGGELSKGAISADEDGLLRLVARLGPEVRGCIEMMSGAVWVRDSLQACGWTIEIADARKVKAIAPLACKTDRVDARVLADLVRRDLVPTVWVPPLDDRAIRERLRPALLINTSIRPNARVAASTDFGDLLGVGDIAPNRESVTQLFGELSDPVLPACD